MGLGFRLVLGLGLGLASSWRTAALRRRHEGAERHAGVGRSRRTGHCAVMAQAAVERA